LTELRIFLRALPTYIGCIPHVWRRSMPRSTALGLLLLRLSLGLM
jgi:hypothetical protein